MKDYSGYRFSLLIGDDTCRIMVGCAWCAHPSIHSFDGVGTVNITVGCLTSTQPSIRTKACTSVELLGRLWARPPVLTPVPSQAIHSRACLKSHHSDIQGTAQKSPCVHTFFKKKKNHRKRKKVCHCLGAWDGWSGHGNTGACQDTRDNRHVRQQRERG